VRTGKDGKRRNMEITAATLTSAVARGASNEEVDALETQALSTRTEYVKALTGNGTAKGIGWQQNGALHIQCCSHQCRLPRASSNQQPWQSVMSVAFSCSLWQLLQRVMSCIISWCQ
jgi:hypothetical protein